MYYASASQASAIEKWPQKRQKRRGGGLLAVAYGTGVLLTTTPILPKTVPSLHREGFQPARIRASHDRAKRRPVFPEVSKTYYCSYYCTLARPLTLTRSTYENLDSSVGIGFIAARFFVDSRRPIVLYAVLGVGVACPRALPCYSILLYFSDELAQAEHVDLLWPGPLFVRSSCRCDCMGGGGGGVVLLLLLLFLVLMISLLNRNTGRRSTTVAIYLTS